MTAEWLVVGVLFAGLLVYSLTGGADFGGGVWDLFASGPRARQQRDTIDRAIGPIWEANHVWLILVIVLLFVCFPPAFATISTALHLPLTLMLLGIVLRGTAFVFRHYDLPRWHSSWSRVFALASVWTPFFLGVSLGAVASGTMRHDPVTGHVITDFISDWLAPFPLAVGAFTVSLFALLAAVYLTLEADNHELREDFRRRALVASVFTGLTAYGSLALASLGAPQLYEGLTVGLRAWVFQGGTFLLAVGLVATLWWRQYRASRALVVLLVIAVELGWGTSHLPYVIPPDLTLDNAAAPNNVLTLFLTILGIGSVLLVPSFFVLYRVFKGRRVFRI